MSMHLEGPWLNKTGRSRAKTKFRSAEHKRQHEQLEADWQELQKKHQAVIKSTQQEKLRKNAGLNRKWSLSIPEGRGTDHIPSLSTSGGSAVKKDSPMYTGDKVKGIGTMHKSNAVPIFSDEEAVEISQMRRG